MEVENMMRSESILILPKNTLRLTDVMVQLEIYNAQNKLFKEKFDETIWKIVSRTNKDLSLYNDGVDKDLIDQLYKINFHKYYELSPATLMCKIIEVLNNQKFIKKTTVLFSDKKCTDSVYEYDYYDGSIKSLENYILKNNITCIIFDDMDILKELSDRKNVSLDEKTFFVSKLGYNYYRDDKGILKLKYYDDLHKEYPKMELVSVDLFNFSKETIEKFNKK